MKFLFIILCFLSSITYGSEVGSWDLDATDDDSNVWSDYAEAKPDIYPDAWQVKKLAAFEGDEIMLRSSAGALLRWVSHQELADLNSAFKKIQKVSETKAFLYLMQGDSPNAAAGEREGQNVVFVNFAMMNLIGDNQSLWAALLGHELAHLKLAHGEQRAKRSIPLSILKNIGKAVVADPLSNMASGLLFDSVGASFSRKAETQADYMGVIWAIEANYDPFGAVELHRRINDIAKGISIPFLNDHPSGEARIKELDALAQRLSKK